MPRKSLIIIAVMAVIGTAAIVRYVGTGDGVDRFSRALEQLSSAGSFSAGVSADFTTSSGGMGSMPLRIRGVGDFGHSQEGMMKARADLAVEAGDPFIEVMTVAARLPGDGEFYAMLSGLPEDLDEFIDVSGLDGTWFTVGEDETEMLLPWLSGGAEGSSFGFSGIGEVADGRKLLLPGRRYDDTVMEGVPVAHYEAFVDRLVLANGLVDLTESLRGRPCTYDEKSAILEYVSSREFRAEAWIDIRNDRFYLIKVGAVPMAGTEGSPSSLTVKFTGFGSPVVVEAPDGARPLSSVLVKLLRGSVPTGAAE